MTRREVLVVGATGATGQVLVPLLLADLTIERVHLVVRRQTPWDDHPRVQRHAFDIPALPQLVPLTDLYCCLGTTAKQAGSRAAFCALDRDTVVDIGHWAKNNGVGRFHVISAASASSKSLSFYLRTKGEMEDQLDQLGLNALVIYRPPLLGERNRDFRLGEKVGELVLGSLGKLPGLGAVAPLPVKVLARAMVAMSQKAITGRQVLGTARIRTLGTG